MPTKLSLGTSNISGTLNVTAAGAVTGTGDLNVTGTTTLAAGSGNDITLDCGERLFHGVSLPDAMPGWSMAMR